MIDLMAKVLTQKLIDGDIISIEDNSIYTYGLQLLLSTIAKMCAIFAIAFVLGWTKEVVIFILFFSSLRIKAGGYHANSYFGCFVMTSLLIFPTVFLVKNVRFFSELWFIVGALLIAITLIYRFAPVDTPNKPLDSQEKLEYREKSRKLIISYAALILMIYFARKGLVLYCSIASLAILIESFTLIPDGLKNEI